GRCFRCQKRGHVASQCGRLAQLPVEMLEMICEDLAMPYPSLSFPYRMFDLRLTCKEINDKTHNFFGKIAFSRLAFRLEYRDLNRVVEISKSSFASFAEFLTFRTYNRVDWQEYEADKQALENADLSQRQRRLTEARLHRARRAEEDEDFVQCSSMDGILLGSALQRMQNVRNVMVPHFEGVRLSALWMPTDILTQLSELRRLELYVQTKDESFENPSSWHTYLAKFLTNCQQLQHLHLGFRDDWKDTPEIFKAVAKNVKPPKLESLHLDYIRCTGQDLKDFLQANSSLHRLDLNNIDITGPTVAFADILELLSTTMTSLKSFKCRQVSQNSLRLHFETLGNITNDSNISFLSRHGLDFFQDFTWVSGPSIYDGRAEEWEGVPQKLGLLKNDVVLGWRTYHADHDDIVTHWMA
ncbi:hypothetical protein EJ03DRAFT_270493, partial [Teratosphaeria nubilosa]